MKKIILLISTLIFAITLSGCSSSDSKSFYDNYIGGSYQDNYIWGGAMNLAWNDLKDNVLGEKAVLKSTDKEVIEMVRKLNESPFSKSDLDSESYYVKSGYGQDTVKKINKESREKFPSKSFSDLSLVLRPIDFIVYAYFLKEVEYLIPFSEDDVSFLKDRVKGFYASGKEEKDNIRILKYWNDDKFIISLRLKEKNDEIILAKGFDMESPRDALAEVSKHKKTTKLEPIDEFRMPSLNLSYDREYKALIGQSFANAKFSDYSISKMVEKINFKMDYKGARIENEATIGAAGASMPDKDEPKPKLFYLNKPFWVIMKRTDSNNPFFLLGVNNINVMEKTVPKKTNVWGDPAPLD
jgi:hypothetical protein